MFSELERSRLWAASCVKTHMTVAWLNRQLIRSESVVVRTLVERQREYIVLSQHFAGISFYGLVDKTCDEYIVTRFEHWNRNDYWESSLQNLLVTREIRLVTTCGVRLVTRGDRDLAPAHPFTRWTWVDSRFVREFAYIVACYRDRRPTFLKDTLLGRICLLFVFFCNFFGNFDF